MMRKRSYFLLDISISMHNEILSEDQKKLLPLVKKFSKQFFLVGGTAIALHIGHRESIDFDLFSFDEFDNNKIRSVIKRFGRNIGQVYKDEDGQFTFFIGTVQHTFFHYPFSFEVTEMLNDVIRMPDLLTLAAMKAYALGRRAKWKDYVDLYFIMRDYHSLDEIVVRGKEIFAGEFNGRIFREQLGYFDDIDYTQEVVFSPGYEVSEKKIKKELIEFSLS